ncbi:hypothetical protein GGI21_000437 [Coemansia aciculifera]|nr:hypothetical protein GGI21_000437 [Coemansia aciculifera]
MTTINTGATRVISIAGRGRDTIPYNEFRVVWVSGVPGSFTQEKIEGVFGDVGRIDAVRMAIDGSGRFVGKAEIVYHLAEDARSAIQVFDGEMLYGTDDVRVQKLTITYSSIANADYIDGLKHKQTRGDQQHRQQQRSRDGYNSQRNGGSGGGGGAARRHQDNGDNRPTPTTEQLDADLDAYMGGSEDASNESAPPNADTRAAEA